MDQRTLIGSARREGQQIFSSMVTLGALSELLDAMSLKLVTYTLWRVSRPLFSGARVTR